MKLRFFTIPVWDGGSAEEALNQFLAQHRILSIDRYLVPDGKNSAWALCVSYAEGDTASAATKKSKIDYREVLNAEDFAVYTRLRDLRKEISEKEAIPPYAVFTNEQLAALVERKVLTPSAMREITGIGDSKVEKYAAPFLKILREVKTNEA